MDNVQQPPAPAQVNPVQESSNISQPQSASSVPTIPQQSSGRGSKVLMLFLALVIIGLGAALAYVVLVKEGETESTDATAAGQEEADDTVGNTLEFGRYVLIFPDGWSSEGAVESIVAVDIVEECIMDPSIEDLQNLTGDNSCVYAFIENEKFDDLKIKITDTDKVSLGGGGYITTYAENVSLTSGGYSGEFSSVWVGQFIDSDKPEIGTEKYIIDGKPLLYYITGSLQDDLHLHVNVAPRGESNEFDEQYVEEFEDFISNLIIKIS